MARSTIIRARNTTGATLVAGTVVYISGYDEDDQVPTIAPADNRYEDMMPAVGMLRADIKSGEKDVVKISGPVSSIDTSGREVNDNIYVGINGGITFVEPATLDETTLTQQIGTVRRVADYPDGGIQLFPLEVKRRISHPELIDVLEDQHHIRLHAETHRPNGADQFIHASQHEVGGSDPISHSLLSDLGDDLHPQYSLVDGTRAFTGVVSGITPTSSTNLTTKAYVDLHSLVDGTRAFTGVVSGITPTVSTHLATKGYVDSQISGAAWRDPVIDKDLAIPPGSPSANDRYIVATGGTGSWFGHDDELAEWNGSSWDFTSPTEGHAAWVNDEDAIYVWSGTAWTKVSGSNVTGSGINGEVTFWSGASAVTSDSNFTWDNTEKRLGIGTASPGESIETTGAIKLGTTAGTANGTIRWSGSDLEGRVGGAWVSLTTVLGTHALAGASHSSSTLSALNLKISDATLIDTTDSRLSDARNPLSHDLGGAAHGTDTLANLNAKVSDATLIDTGDSRLSDDRTASGLRTTSTTVAISASTAPTAGQVLKALSNTVATWQDDAAPGLEQTVSEHYQQHSEAITTIKKDLDGYASDQTVSEHYIQHSEALATIRKDLDGYASSSHIHTEYASEQTVSEHYQQHSEAITTIKKDLDGYASDQTVSEHYVQYSDAIATILKDLDGYCGVSAASGSSADGYLAFFIGSGEDTIAGDNDLYYDRVNDSLRVNKLDPAGTLKIDGPIALLPTILLDLHNPSPDSTDGYGLLYYADGYQLYMKREDGTQTNLNTESELRNSTTSDYGTGETWNGRTIYRRFVNFGAGPNIGTKTVESDIPPGDGYTVVNIKAIANNFTAGFDNDGYNDIIVYNKMDQKVYFTSDADRSGYDYEIAIDYLRPVLAEYGSPTGAPHIVLTVVIADPNETQPRVDNFMGLKQGVHIVYPNTAYTSWAAASSTYGETFYAVGARDGLSGEGANEGNIWIYQYHSGTGATNVTSKFSIRVGAHSASDSVAGYYRFSTYNPAGVVSGSEFASQSALNRIKDKMFRQNVDLKGFRLSIARAFDWPSFTTAG